MMGMEAAMEVVMVAIEVVIMAAIQEGMVATGEVMEEAMVPMEEAMMVMEEAIVAMDTESNSFMRKLMNEGQRPCTALNTHFIMSTFIIFHNTKIKATASFEKSG